MPVHSSCWLRQEQPPPHEHTSAGMSGPCGEGEGEACRLRSLHNNAGSSLSRKRGLAGMQPSTTRSYILHWCIGHLALGPCLPCIILWQTFCPAAPCLLLRGGQSAVQLASSTQVGPLPGAASFAAHSACPWPQWPGATPLLACPAPAPFIPAAHCHSVGYAACLAPLLRSQDSLTSPAAR